MRTSSYLHYLSKTAAIVDSELNAISDNANAKAFATTGKKRGVNKGYSLDKERGPIKEQKTKKGTKRFKPFRYICIMEGRPPLNCAKILANKRIVENNSVT